jgi:hypothetical protein
LLHRVLLKLLARILAALLLVGAGATLRTSLSSWVALEALAAGPDGADAGADGEILDTSLECVRILQTRVEEAVRKYPRVYRMVPIEDDPTVANLCFRDSPEGQEANQEFKQRRRKVVRVTLFAMHYMQDPKFRRLRDRDTISTASRTFFDGHRFDLAMPCLSMTSDAPNASYVVSEWQNSQGILNSCETIECPSFARINEKLQCVYRHFSATPQSATVDPAELVYYQDIYYNPISERFSQPPPFANMDDVPNPLSPFKRACERARGVLTQSQDGTPERCVCPNSAAVTGVPSQVADPLLSATGPFMGSFLADPLLMGVSINPLEPNVTCQKVTRENTDLVCRLKGGFYHPLNRCLCPGGASRIDIRQFGRFVDVPHC